MVLSLLSALLFTHPAQPLLKPSVIHPDTVVPCRRAEGSPRSDSAAFPCPWGVREDALPDGAAGTRLIFDSQTEKAKQGCKSGCLLSVSRLQR